MHQFSNRALQSNRFFGKGKSGREMNAREGRALHDADEGDQYQ
jgi:hypothetical protein